MCTSPTKLKLKMTGLRRMVHLYRIIEDLASAELWGSEFGGAAPASFLGKKAVLAVRACSPGLGDCRRQLRLSAGSLRVPAELLTYEAPQFNYWCYAGPRCPTTAAATPRSPPVHPKATGSARFCYSQRLDFVNPKGLPSGLLPP